MKKNKTSKFDEAMKETDFSDQSISSPYKVTRLAGAVEHHLHRNHDPVAFAYPSFPCRAFGRFGNNILRSSHSRCNRAIFQYHWKASLRRDPSSQPRVAQSSKQGSRMPWEYHQIHTCTIRGKGWGCSPRSPMRTQSSGRRYAQ